MFSKIDSELDKAVCTKRKKDSHKKESVGCQTGSAVDKAIVNRAGHSDWFIWIQFVSFELFD